MSHVSLPWLLIASFDLQHRMEASQTCCNADGVQHCCRVSNWQCCGSADGCLLHAAAGVGRRPQPGGVALGVVLRAQPQLQGRRRRPPHRAGHRHGQPRLCAQRQRQVNASVCALLCIPGTNADELATSRTCWIARFASDIRPSFVCRAYIYIWAYTSGTRSPQCTRTWYDCMVCRLVRDPDRCQGRTAMADVCDPDLLPPGEARVELVAGDAGLR